jgi:hypothetical protein
VRLLKDILPAPAMNTFNDRNWRNLLMDIEQRQVIPIIGPELLMLGEGPTQTTLYQHVAKELVSPLSLAEQQLPPGYGLLGVSSFHSIPGTPPDAVY